MITFTPFHPNAVYLNKKEKQFNSYFNNVKKLYPQYDYILRLDGNDHYNHFLEKGFIECRRTYDLNIDIKQLLVYLEYLNKGFVRVLNDEFFLTDNLIFKWYEIYKKTHQVNPVKSFELKEFEEILIKGLDFENSIVIVNNKAEILGYILIYIDENNIREIGYIYFKNDTVKIRLMRVLFSRLHHLKNIGSTNIVAEVDNTDKYSYGFFTPFINNNSEFLRTLIYKNKMRQFSTSKIDLKDVPSILRWSQDLEFCKLNDWPLYRSTEEVISWWKEVIRAQSNRFERKMIVVNNNVIGYFDVYAHDENTLELVIAIGDKDYRGKGFGTLLFSKITACLRVAHPSKKIIAITSKTNIPSQRMIIKSGYVLFDKKDQNHLVEQNELIFRFF